MAKSRSKLIIAGIVIVALLVATGIFVWWPAYQRWGAEALAVGEARFESKRSSGRPSESERKRRFDWDKFYESLLARHPELAVEYKEVPDHQNGFLQLIEFEKRWKGDDGLLRGLPEDIRAMIRGVKPCDLRRVEQWLAENPTLLSEIQAIGLMPDQSAKGVEHPNPAMGVSSMLLTQCAGLLELQARLHAERGSSSEALASLQAVMGLANHLDQIETPNMMHETMALLLRMRSSRYFFDELLPHLASGEQDLVAWERVMVGQSPGPSEFGRVLRGEWHTGVRYLLPLSLPGGEVPPDLDRLGDAWADLVARRVQACESATVGGLWQAIDAVQASGEGLSPQSGAILKLINEGSSTWPKGWIRCQLLDAQQQAAFAHLLGEPLPNEPITGKPFVWDEATQSILFPEDERLAQIELKPLVVLRSAK
jgi:hypothetical protein